MAIKNPPEGYHSLTPYLLGQDPTRIERLAAVIRDAAPLGPPPYGLEIPLWDLLVRDFLG